MMGPITGLGAWILVLLTVGTVGSVFAFAIYCFIDEWRQGKRKNKGIPK